MAVLLRLPLSRSRAAHTTSCDAAELHALPAAAGAERVPPQRLDGAATQLRVPGKHLCCSSQNVPREAAAVGHAAGSRAAKLNV